MATETYIIQIRQQGAQETTQQINNIGKAAKSSADTLAFFRKALVTLSAIRAVEGIVEFVDAAARIDNTLRASTRTLEDFNRAQEFVYKLSRETRTAVEANATVFGRLIRSTEGLGLSMTRLENIQKALSLSIKVGGATSQEARNALVQFSQSLASGALRGDELRSVSEQLPGLARAIGKEFGVAGGSLIAFAKANPGILETKKVLAGVEKSLPQLQAQFALLKPTITEGFDVLKNAIIQSFGEIQGATNLFGLLSRALIIVADNLNTIAEVAGIVAIAFAGMKLNSYITTLYGLTAAFRAEAASAGIAAATTRAFTAAIAANPVGAVITVIAALASALVVLYNESDTAAAIIDGLWNAFVVGLSALKPVWDFLVTALTPAFNQVMVVLTQLSPIITYIGDGFSLLGEAATILWGDFINVTSQFGLTTDGANILGQAITTLQGTIAAIITFALSPFVLAVQGVVNVLYAFGGATEETTNMVNQFVADYFSMKGAFDTTTPSVDTATNALKSHTDAANTASNANGGLAASFDAADEGAKKFYKTIYDGASQTITATQYLKNLNSIVIETAAVTGNAADVLDRYTDAITKAGAASQSVGGDFEALAATMNKVAAAYDNAAAANSRYDAADVAQPSERGGSSSSRSVSSSGSGGSTGTFSFSSPDEIRKRAMDQVDALWGSGGMEGFIKDLISQFQSSIKQGGSNSKTDYKAQNDRPSIQDQRPVLVQMTIATPNVDSFRLSQDQINRSLARAIQGAVNRG